MTRKFFTKAKQTKQETKMPARKVGRPKTIEGEITALSIRLTQAEYEQIELYVKTMYIEPRPSMTAVVKYVLLNATRLKG